MSFFIAILLFLPLKALAHSHIDYLIINGTLYPGFDPSGRVPNTNDTVGWSTTAADDGFVPPENYTTPDIICHRDGAPAPAHAPVTAGESIHVQWNGWPLSHRGPVQSYIAPCVSVNTTANAKVTARSDGCASIDKTTLRWTKIDDSAPVFFNESIGLPGLWSSNMLIGANNSWQVRIPSTLATGAYVLRHEIIALHYANQLGGAQNYPQCLNLWVTGMNGTGTVGSAELQRTGFKATEMYHAEDPGIHVNIYETQTTYAIPGPTMVSWAKPVPPVEQTKSALSGRGTPVVVVSGSRTEMFGARKTPRPGA